MSCPDDAVFCLGDHVVSHLEGVTGSQDHYRARCPAHADRAASLTISRGDRHRFVWRCFAGCTDTEVRAALVARGVPDSCLPHLSRQRTEDELVAVLLPLLKEGGPGPLLKLRIAAAVLNVELPRGGRELEDFAAQFGISKTAAYRATEPLRDGGQNRYAAGAAGGQTRPHVLTPEETVSQNPPAKPQVDGARNGFEVVPEPGLVVPEPGQGNRFQTVSSVPEPGQTVSPQRCEICERELSFEHRSHARYCSDRCRLRAHRARNRKDSQ